MMRILVVDDDEDSAALMAALLERQGWKADISCSAEQARLALSSGQYQVLVTDMYLPDGLGMSLLDPAPSALCGAFLVTGALDEAHRRESTAAGFHRCFAKPVNVPELLGAIRALPFTKEAS
jgi:DNA-binding response OmpR family regulator